MLNSFVGTVQLTLSLDMGK